MSIYINILTSDATYDRLFALAHGRRKEVKIRTEELLHLLIDYSHMLGAISNNSSFKIVEAAKRTRPRLKLSEDKYGNNNREV